MMLAKAHKILKNNIPEIADKLTTIMHHLKSKTTVVNFGEYYALIDDTGNISFYTPSGFKISKEIFINMVNETLKG